jgi:hypothetical protein
MTEGVPTTALELEDVLRRLEDSRQQLMDALAACDAQQFDIEAADGESIKRALERSSDDLNFYYGRLVARAMSLPQPPCLTTADFVSLREAVMSLQVAHRRFSNLLHDLLPADLERQAMDEEHGSYTMRQLLEMAAAAYDVRRQQVNRIAAAIASA